MDIVFIRQLQIDTVIGVYEWEKTITQRLEIDLELATDIRQAAAQDDIRLTLDYAVIATRVQQLICAEPIELIETVAEKIATMLLQQFATQAVRVRVCKPTAVANAQTVGVQISRGQLGMTQIYISVGSNTNREHHIRMAVVELAAAFGELTLSSVYESEAVGFRGDAFYNMVIGARTSCSVAECVTVFKAIEDKYGRVRGGEKFCGRTLDLDLLTYDDLVCAEPVELPRAEIVENAFVLWPLAEIAPQVRHPVVHISYLLLWQQYTKAQKIWPVPFLFEP